MQLSKQEDILLERMALHMAATGDMDIGRAVDAVRNQDRELLAKLAALGDKRETLKAGDYHYEGENGLVAMRSAMARRVYKNIRARGNAWRVAPEIDGAVTITGRSDLPGRPLRYMIHGEKVAYVSFEAVQLHIQGICKSDCPRCALQHLIN
ncbi:hypothetical protein [Stutzerimonas nitrititolerans]|uniref:hypothetical protein n=1 Tax=Stutzerimonas nitrititolerans TaxID=2482751 RepID=UPI0028B11E90|nr:hypothetical protein [Stutzerimonas nitrititolerans]